MVLSNGHIIKAKTSSVFVRVEIDNSLRWKQIVKWIKIKAIMTIFAPYTLPDL